MQLAKLATEASEQYSKCAVELDALAAAEFPAEAVPQQLRAMEEQLQQRLQVRWGLP